MYATIVSQLDAEIAKLQQARTILAGIGTLPAIVETKRRGRPKGSISKSKVVAVLEPTKRTMSPEGRARVAAAQKKRWAAKRKAAKKEDAVAG